MGMMSELSSLLRDMPPAFTSDPTENLKWHMSVLKFD